MKHTIEASGLLFDMDGVLVSSLSSVRRSWRAWALEFGVANADALELPHGTRAVDIIRMLAPTADVEHGLARINAIEVADVDDVVVLAGVPELLRSLPPERWAIVTSATRELLIARLRAARLPLPPHTVTGSDVERGKPDPQPYERGAAMLGIAASQCIVVEDAPEGVRAGRAAGARVLGIRGTVPDEQLRAAGAGWVVDSLAAVSVKTSQEATTGQDRLQLTVEE